jgi:hypothetical protein
MKLQLRQSGCSRARAAKPKSGRHLHRFEAELNDGLAMDSRPKSASISWAILF